eukprot:2486530-Prymnesium_polylepis.1
MPGGTAGAAGACGAWAVASSLKRQQTGQNLNDRRKSLLEATNSIGGSAQNVMARLTRTRTRDLSCKSLVMAKRSSFCEAGSSRASKREADPGRRSSLRKLSRELSTPSETLF